MAAPNLDLYFLRNGTDALAIVTRRLERYKNPLRVASLTVPLSGTSIDLGDVFYLQAIDGIGPDGYTAADPRPYRCTRHELDPNANTTTIEGYDIERVLSPP